MRRFALPFVVAVALAAASAASGAFPAPYAVQGGGGVVGPHGVRFDALAATGSTRLVAIVDASGKQVREATVAGAFGIPTLTQAGLAGGLSRDGRTLVLQGMGLHATSRFTLVRTRDLAVLRTIRLRGTFGFDALSPDSSRLYLIQHSSAQDVQHYVVRAYDLRRHRLLAGRIADKTQRGWIMQGWAVSRATTANGRWAYTLYANPGGYPFVHALDTVRGVAHCVGLPWKAVDQTPVWMFRLAVKGGALLVERADGSVWRRVDRTSWSVSTP
jgi:hypothetical protein